MDLLGMFASAWGLALLLGLPMAWRAWRRGQAVRAMVLHRVAVLGLVGSAVLLAGLWLTGHDGRMLTYAALVLTMGPLAAWLDRPAAQ